MKNRIVELSLDINIVDPDQAVLESEREGPVVFEVEARYQSNDDAITDSQEVVFRVAFEPDNTERRRQPFRETIEPIFPNNWKIGDDWPDQHSNDYQKS